MARFSIGTAFSDAFGLIGRRPLSVFVWGLLLLLPSAGTILVVLPMLSDVIASSGAGMEPDFRRMMQHQSMSGLLHIVQLLVMAVVYTAIMRAVIRPKEKAVFSLRLGMDELRVAVVGVAVFIGFYLALVVLVLLVAAAGFAIMQLDAPGNWIAIAALVLVLILGVWLMLARVSLIAPASVLYRDFAFVQGWRLGRGQTWPLFGMMLLLVVVVLVIETIALIAGLAAFGVGAAFTDMENVEVWADPANWGDPMPWLMANWIWCALGGVVLSFVYGMVLTLGIAPFASACRQLADSSAPPPAAEPMAEDAAPAEPAHAPEH
tara:strand:- start:1288 stop:2247 length:960 start_codon:yes stop_codon:yes gene_type:complete